MKGIHIKECNKCYNAHTYKMKTMLKEGTSMAKTEIGIEQGTEIRTQKTYFFSCLYFLICLF